MTSFGHVGGTFLPKGLVIPVSLALVGMAVFVGGTVLGQPLWAVAGGGGIAAAFLILTRLARASGATTNGGENAARLETILAHVPISFLLLDRERRILTVSGDFEAITGRRLEELAGRHCTRALWSEGFCQGCPTERAVDSQRPETEVVRVPARDGSVRYFEHTSIPVRRGGRVVEVVEIVTDVTERRLFQEELVRTEKLASVGEMATVIAHEMRNALTSVKMILQLSRESSHTDPESIEVALESIAHSDEVMQQLLNFARPKAPHLTKISIPELIEESTRLVRPQFERRGAVLQVESPIDLPWIRGDLEQLRSALVNVLLNASQAVSAGGHAVLRARCVSLPRPLTDVRRRTSVSVEPLEPTASRQSDAPERTVEKIRLPAGSDVLILELEDDGPGLPSERLNRVFDPFYTTKVNGTGLGLSLVKQVANDHGGMAIIENGERGCRVSIVLPTVAEPPESP